MVFVGILKQIGVLLFRYLTPVVVFFRSIIPMLIRSPVYHFLLLKMLAGIAGTAVGMGFMIYFLNNWWSLISPHFQQNISVGGQLAGASLHLVNYFYQQFYLDLCLSLYLGTLAIRFSINFLSAMFHRGVFQRF